MGSLPSLSSLTLRTHNIDALSITTADFLQNHPFPLKVLTVYLVPLYRHSPTSHERVLLEFFNSLLGRVSWRVAARGFSLEGSRYEKKYFREKLREAFDERFHNKVTSLQLYLQIPETRLGGDSSESDTPLLNQVQSLVVDLLPSWESTGKSVVGICQGEQWQNLDSLERINVRVWGCRDVPNSDVLTRVGTL